MSTFHVGTSGWSYKHWREIFYPLELKPAQWFEYYAARLNCVELNTTFYHLPQSQTVKDWKKRAPANFKFCFKLSRYLTQFKKLSDPDEPLKTFFDRMQPLRSCAGPVLVQLPANFGFDAERAETFFKAVRRFRSYRFALEPRHKTWFEDSALELMQKYRIALVIADSGGRFPSRDAVTADFVYLRLHGPDARLLYASNYDHARLQAYAEQIRGWLEANLDVWAFFNNDVHGFAIENALALEQMVQ